MREVETSKSTTVFVTPIAIEGLDFRGDLARFQMFAKIPFPNKYTDIVMAKRCQRRGYEENYIIRTLRQMWGRICRDDDDWGLTYILDESWEKFYYNNEQRFPEDFRLCLE
jgi:Rad3-related DNA helicase